MISRAAGCLSPAVSAARYLCVPAAAVGSGLASPDTGQLIHAAGPGAPGDGEPHSAGVAGHGAAGTRAPPQVNGTGGDGIARVHDAPSGGGGSRRATPRVAPPTTPGTRLTTTRAFTLEDVTAFTALTGDTNPLHTNAAAAARAGHAAPVVPGLLLASLFPALVGSAYPGSLYLTQTLKFVRPATVGQPTTAEVVVSRSKAGRVMFECRCKCEGRVLVKGEALALIGPQAHAAEASR